MSIRGDPAHLGFRPLKPDDLALLEHWHRLPHVERWWGPWEDAQGGYLDTDEPVGYHIVLLDDEPVGMIQHYRWSDFPAEADAVGARPGEAGLDYFIGDPKFTGRGLGAVMIGAFVEQVVGRTGATAIRIDVSEANERSWRCLEHLGFKRVASGVRVPGERGPHRVYMLDL